MIRRSNSIATRFDKVVKELCELVASEISTSRELQENVLKKISEAFSQRVGVINSQSKQINSLSLQKKDNVKIIRFIGFCADLVSCGVIDGKRKENLRSEIIDQINEPQ